ncbi:MAG TPA: type IV toxin-antitoxin system AbiEi family antitoxin domain-containing protein [Archangium sp.]
MTWSAAEAAAVKQRGLITLEQFRIAGLSDSTVRRGLGEGRLLRVVNGVYRFAVTPETWDLRARAALMVRMPEDVLSHASAAVLWGLQGYERKNTPITHLSVFDRRQQRLGENFLIHRPRRPFVPYWLNDYPVTRLARTIVDIAGDLTEERLEMLLDAAHHRRPCLQRWLESELAPLNPKSYPGVGTLSKLLAVRRGVAVESTLETKLRRFVREYGVEEPTYQLEIYDHLGRIMRVDVAWESHLLALHGDSYQWHGDRKTFDDDAAKRRRLVAAGWASVAVTSTDLKNPAWFESIKKLLHDRAPQRSLFGLQEIIRSAQS